MTDTKWNYETNSDGNWNMECRNTQHRFGRLICRLVVAAVLYAGWIMILKWISSTNSREYIGVLSAVCIFFGWKVLTAIQPRMFLFMPIIGWVLYFGVKALISVPVGLALAPWFIAKKLIPGR